MAGRMPTASGRGERQKFLAAFADADGLTL
jgi:hypothetical protein